MTSLLNRVLKGQKASYQVLEVLKQPSVFKARVLPIQNPAPFASHPLSPKPVVIKTFTSAEAWEIEHEVHIQPEFKNCPFIRQLEDVIDIDSQEGAGSTESPKTKSLVFEWMDSDLWHALPHGQLAHPKLPQILAKSILEALLVLQKYPAVHIDMNPNNIFLSGLDGPNPVVKLGDLAQTRMEGDQKGNPDCQPIPCRAPEVWKGLGVWHKSDTWAFAVTMVHWLRSGTLFGPRDKIIKEHTAAWCIAKIIRLVGPVDLPPENAKYFSEFKLAQHLERSNYEHPKTGMPMPFITVKTLREELEVLPRELCSTQCIEFLEHLLVIDPNKRPTAEEGLKHHFIRSL